MAADQWKCPHCGNPAPTPVTPEQDARVALLEHYTSQMQGYKVYLLTLVIGFFAGIESLRTLQLSIEYFPVFFSLGVGLLVAGTIFCSARAFFFGQHVRDVIREDSDCKQTMLDQFDRLVHTKRDMVRENPWSNPAERWLIRRGACGSRLSFVAVLIGILVFIVTWLIVYWAAAEHMIGLGLKCGQCVQLVRYSSLFSLLGFCEKRSRDFPGSFPL